MSRSRREARPIAVAARRLAEALDARFDGARNWRVVEGELETSIYALDRGDERCVAALRPAGDRLIVRTQGTCAGEIDEVFDDPGLPGIVERISATVTTPLTRWDLRPGLTFRLRTPLRGLETGGELRLVAIDEVKPSGRDLYRFAHAAGSLDLYCDRPDDAAILDDIAAYLER